MTAILLCPVGYFLGLFSISPALEFVSVKYARALPSLPVSQIMQTTHSQQHQAVLCVRFLRCGLDGRTSGTRYTQVAD